MTRGKVIEAGISQRFREFDEPSHKCTACGKTALSVFTDGSKRTYKHQIRVRGTGGAGKVARSYYCVTDLKVVK